MTRRKRRRSEQKAAELAQEEQGDLLSGVPGGEPAPEAGQEGPPAEVDVPPPSGPAATEESADVDMAPIVEEATVEALPTPLPGEADVEVALPREEATPEEVTAPPSEEATTPVDLAPTTEEAEVVPTTLAGEADVEVGVAGAPEEAGVEVTPAAADAEPTTEEADNPTAEGDTGDGDAGDVPSDSAADASEDSAEESADESADEPADEPPAVVWEFPLRRSITFELVAEEIPAGEPPKPPPAGDRLARAKERVQQGRVHEAAELYRSILDENPANLKARNNLGALYEALGQHELALEQFEAAVRVEPENVEVLNNLGSTLAVLGRYEEGEVALRRALRLSPDSVDLRASLGILYFRRGIYAQAEAELRWVCEQDREHGNAFFYRGEALNRLGRVDEAMAALEQATVLQPTNAKAFYTLGILYDRKHLREEAALMYRRSRELQKG